MLVIRLSVADYPPFINWVIVGYEQSSVLNLIRGNDHAARFTTNSDA